LSANVAVENAREMRRCTADRCADWNEAESDFNSKRRIGENQVKAHEEKLLREDTENAPTEIMKMPAVALEKLPSHQQTVADEKLHRYPCEMMKVRRMRLIM
jgi:hypothetical protein